MRFDKSNPKIYFYFSVSFFNFLVAVLLRKLLLNKENTIVLYGHKLNGNLQAFKNFMFRYKEPETFYLTLDPIYFKKLKRTGKKNILCSFYPWDMLKVVRASIFISDHGPGFFFLLKKFAVDMKFIDVWHGVGHKGQKSEDFKFMHFYDHVFVTSFYFKKKYKEWGFTDKQIVITGYARTDQLLNLKKRKIDKIKNYFGVTNFSKIVLYAPTFTSQGTDESIFPINEESLEKINREMVKKNSVLIFRQHLNSKIKISEDWYSNIKFMPMEEYPETEKLLMISDVLITDWSSIANDFMILNRPIIYLDTPLPREGLTLSLDDRPGYIVKNFDKLIISLSKSLSESKRFKKEFKNIRKKTLVKCWGNQLDGMSSKRYLDEIRKIDKDLFFIKK